MSYWDINEMSSDPYLFGRISACAAQEQDGVPTVWAVDNMLRVCAAPGWDEAWASAIAGGIELPGKDPAVISDGQILASVQQVLGVGAA